MYVRHKRFEEIRVWEKKMETANEANARTTPPVAAEVIEHVPRFSEVQMLAYRKKPLHTSRQQHARQNKMRRHARTPRELRADH